jgi:DNA primase
MRYNSEDIDKLINELNIVEVVGEYVDLKRAGSNFKGLCPFHKDNNPSFMVSPSKNICKCFVCGAGGNPIKFYSDYNKISFGEAVKELGDKYKINIKPVKGYDVLRETNKNYYDILNDSLEYFCEKIFSNEGREALEYLSKRKFKPDFISENKIGFAPRGWNNLYDHLLNKGHNIGDILTLGLVKEGDKGYYDSFRNRIMFPIYSPSGNVIAFGGRTLEDKKDIPKYINSSENPVFHKGQNLYGIKEKGSIIRRKAYSIIMEGYMDVLSAHSFGFDVAVASLGTAFTEEQGKLLKRYTSNAILAFDMDNAGRVAAEKSGIILKSHGFNIRVLELGNAKDPDEFLKKYGKSEFLKCVKESKEIFDYLYEFYSREYDLTNLMAKQNFIARFKDFFQAVETDLEKSLYIDKLSKSLELEKGLLSDILIVNNKKNVKNKNTEKFLQREYTGKVEKINKLEFDTLKIILSKPEYFNYFENKNIKNNLLHKIIVFYKEEGLSENAVKIILKSDFFQEEEKKRILEIAASSMEYFDEKNLNRDLREVFLGWFRKEIKEMLEKFKVNEDIISFFKIKKISENIEKTDVKLEEIQNFYQEFQTFNK